MRAFVAAALALAVLTGCATQAPEPVASSATGAGKDAKETKWKLERAKADCMKQKGFKYIPFIMSEPKETEAQKKMAHGDYAAAKEFRTKYGYQAFARYIYPHDSASGALVPEDFGEDPNAKVRMNEAQFRAFETAKQACSTKAFKVVLNKDVSSIMDVANLQRDLSDRLTARRLDGDSELVRLAVTFGDCLKAKGYAVTSLKPSDLAKRGEKAMFAELDKLGDDSHGFPELTAEQARPHFAKEVKDALDDLECGKEFYARYSPISTAIRQEAEEQIPW
ncbi:hypothetical protein AB0B45_12960 [Nonomuraea sp. NPDC049152]|uniref:hypothetical protein n=1 Tax=Nonomuraea sp. NPDC049152 TaxID=3154350 RepID=UPI0033FCA622